MLSSLWGSIVDLVDGPDRNEVRGYPWIPYNVLTTCLREEADRLEAERERRRQIRAFLKKEKTIDETKNKNPPKKMKKQKKEGEQQHNNILLPGQRWIPKYWTSPFSLSSSPSDIRSHSSIVNDTQQQQQQKQHQQRDIQRYQHHKGGVLLYYLSSNLLNDLMVSTAVNASVIKGGEVNGLLPPSSSFSSSSSSSTSSTATRLRSDQQRHQQQQQQQKEKDSAGQQQQQSLLQRRRRSRGTPFPVQIIVEPSDLPEMVAEVRKRLEVNYKHYYYAHRYRHNRHQHRNRYNRNLGSRSTDGLLSNQNSSYSNSNSNNTNSINSNNVRYSYSSRRKMWLAKMMTQKKERKKTDEGETTSKGHQQQRRSRRRRHPTPTTKLYVNNELISSDIRNVIDCLYYVYDDNDNDNDNDATTTTKKTTCHVLDDEFSSSFPSASPKTQRNNKNNNKNKNHLYYYDDPTRLKQYHHQRYQHQGGASKSSHNNNNNNIKEEEEEAEGEPFNYYDESFYNYYFPASIPAIHITTLPATKQCVISTKKKFDRAYIENKKNKGNKNENTNANNNKNTKEVGDSEVLRTMNALQTANAYLNLMMALPEYVERIVFEKSLLISYDTTVCVSSNSGSGSDGNGGSDRHEEHWSAYDNSHNHHLDSSGSGGGEKEAESSAATTTTTTPSRLSYWWYRYDLVGAPWYSSSSVAVEVEHYKGVQDSVAGEYAEWKGSKNMKIQRGNNATAMDTTTKTHTHGRRSDGGGDNDDYDRMMETYVAEYFSNTDFHSYNRQDPVRLLAVKNHPVLILLSVYDDIAKAVRRVGKLVKNKNKQEEEEVGGGEHHHHTTKFTDLLDILLTSNTIPSTVSSTSTNNTFNSAPSFSSSERDKGIAHLLRIDTLLPTLVSSLRSTIATINTNANNNTSNTPNTTPHLPLLIDALEQLGSHLSAHRGVDRYRSTGSGSTLYDYHTLVLTPLLKQYITQRRGSGGVGTTSNLQQSPPATPPEGEDEKEKEQQQHDHDGIIRAATEAAAAEVPPSFQHQHSSRLRYPFETLTGGTFQGNGALSIRDTRMWYAAVRQRVLRKGQIADYRTTTTTTTSSPSSSSNNDDDEEKRLLEPLYYYLSPPEDVGLGTHARNEVKQKEEDVGSSSSSLGFDGDNVNIYADYYAYDDYSYDAGYRYGKKEKEEGDQAGTSFSSTTTTTTTTNGLGSMPPPIILASHLLHNPTHWRLPSVDESTAFSVESLFFPARVTPIPPSTSSFSSRTKAQAETERTQQNYNNENRPEEDRSVWRLSQFFSPAVISRSLHYDPTVDALLNVGTTPLTPDLTTARTVSVAAAGGVNHHRKKLHTSTPDTQTAAEEEGAALQQQPLQVLIPSVSSENVFGAHICEALHTALGHMDHHYGSIHKLWDMRKILLQPTTTTTKKATNDNGNDNDIGDDGWWWWVMRQRLSSITSTLPLPQSLRVNSSFPTAFSNAKWFGTFPSNDPLLHPENCQYHLGSMMQAEEEAKQQQQKGEKREGNSISISDAMASVVFPPSPLPITTTTTTLTTPHRHKHEATQCLLNVIGTSQQHTVDGVVKNDGRAEEEGRLPGRGATVTQTRLGGRGKAAATTETTPLRTTLDRLLHNCPNFGACWRYRDALKKTKPFKPPPSSFLPSSSYSENKHDVGNGNDDDDNNVIVVYLDLHLDDDEDEDDFDHDGGGRGGFDSKRRAETTTDSSDTSHHDDYHDYDEYDPIDSYGGEYGHGHHGHHLNLYEGYAPPHLPMLLENDDPWLPMRRRRYLWHALYVAIAVLAVAILLGVCRCCCWVIRHRRRLLTEKTAVATFWKKTRMPKTKQLLMSRTAATVVVSTLSTFVVNMVTVTVAAFVSAVRFIAVTFRLICTKALTLLDLHNSRKGSATSPIAGPDGRQMRILKSQQHRRRRVLCLVFFLVICVGSNFGLLSYHQSS